MGSFHHVGGDILYRTVWLSADDVAHFHAIYRAEAWAAFHAGDDKAYEAASSLLKEICDAQHEQARWSRSAQLRGAA